VLNDSAVQVRLASIQALTNLGGPTNPELRLGLFQALEPVAYKDADPSVRIWAHMAVMSITREVHKERVSAIAGVLKHEDFEARVQSALALGTIGRDAKAAIPALIDTLKDTQPAVVGWTMWALGKMEQSAAGALPALEKIKTDMAQPEFLRKIAEESIDQIGGKKKVAAP
jgi:HEAT repeat protein